VKIMWQNRGKNSFANTIYISASEGQPLLHWERKISRFFTSWNGFLLPERNLTEMKRMLRKGSRLDTIDYWSLCRLKIVFLFEIILEESWKKLLIFSHRILFFTHCNWDYAKSLFISSHVCTRLFNCPRVPIARNLFDVSSPEVASPFAPAMPLISMTLSSL